MSKKKQKKIPLTESVSAEQTAPVLSKPAGYRSLIGFWIALSLACIILYGNTLRNEYCLDDAMMITQNEITQKGFGGIREHVEHSFLYGFMHREGYDAASSHWRPLVMISFALDIGLWGSNQPGYSHAVNLLMYIVLVISLFGWLRRYILKNNWLAFFTSFLFAIHPVHTEVVANIKGRDEILCLLLLLFSLHQLWRFVGGKGAISYVFSLLLFFLSMATKENSLTFLAGIPVMLYFFSRLKNGKIVLYSAGYLGVTLVFILIRNALVPLSNMVMSDEVTNNPYLYAKGSEALATKLYVLLLFLKKIVWPYPLSYDYSYNQIPYVGFSSPWVWVSLLLYGGLLVWAITGIRKKSITSFAILMFFITFSVSTNIVVETGVLMAERMLFTPSIFAMLLIVCFCNDLLNRADSFLPVRKPVWTALLLIPVTLLSAGLVISRNLDWRNDTALNLADAPKNPNSVRVNGGAGTACLNLADQKDISKSKKDSLLQQAIRYYQHAVDIHPAYNDAWQNMGVAYSRMDSLYRAEACWNRVRQNNPGASKLVEYDAYLKSTFYNLGISSEIKGSLDSAIFYYGKVQTYSRVNDSIQLGAMYNTAGCYYRRNQFRQAKEILTKLISIYPDYKQAQQGIAACDHFISLENAQARKP